MVTFFLVLFLPSLLFFFTCVVSCFMLLTPNKLPNSSEDKEPLRRPQLSSALGRASDIESCNPSPKMESNEEVGSSRNQTPKPKGIDQPATDTSSIVPVGTLRSDGSRSAQGGPHVCQNGEVLRSPRMTPWAPAKASSSLLKFTPSGITTSKDGESNKSSPELEIVEVSHTTVPG